MNNNIKVSVCIPVYRVEPYIARCVRSLLEQTISGLELIFVNDCTPDNSIQVLEETLKEYQRDDVTVKIIHHEKNMGVTAARFTAMNAVTGKYFIHCDPDDWIEPEMYQSMYDEIIRTDSDMVYCDFEHFDDNGNKKIKKEAKCSSPEDVIKAIISPSCDCWGSLVIKLWRSSVKDNISCPSSISFCEDVIMSVQMLLKCKQVSYIPKAFYHYYTNINGICHSSENKGYNSYIDILTYLKTILSNEDQIRYLISYWQFLMIHSIRWCEPYGKKLFQNIQPEMKALLTRQIEGKNYHSNDMLLVRMAFISYSLTITMFKMYGKIHTIIKK